MEYQKSQCELQNPVSIHKSYLVYIKIRTPSEFHDFISERLCMGRRRAFITVNFRVDRFTHFS
jgi:hypothetical protein